MAQEKQMWKTSRLWRESAINIKCNSYLSSPAPHCVIAIFVGHILPARQLTHADDAVVSAYSPSLHATHTADPRVLYSPLAQSTGVPDKLKHFCPKET